MSKLALAWQHDVNIELPPGSSGPDEAQKMFHRWKTSLTSFAIHPWVVVGSSDAVTASMDGTDRWTSSDKLVGVATSGNHAWIVLRCPATGCQILLSMIVASTTNYHGVRFVVSPGGLFTGGSISADPTATDAMPILDPFRSYGRTNTSTNSVDHHTMHIMRSVGGDVTMWALCKGGVPTAVAYVGRLQNANYENSIGAMWHSSRASAAPFDVLFRHIADNWDTGQQRAWFGNIPNVGVAALFPTFTAVNVQAPHTLANFSDARSALVETRGSLVWSTHNHLLGAHEMPTIGCYCAAAGARGLQGQLYDVRWADAALKSGTVLGSGEWVTMGPWIMPWNSSKPLMY